MCVKRKVFMDGGFWLALNFVKSVFSGGCEEENYDPV